MQKQIETLLIDVDRTLYPFEADVWDAIGERIHTFIQAELNLSAEEATDLRRTLRERYPTTLQGLHSEYGTNEAKYLEFVHDVDLSTLIPPNPELKTIFKALPYRKIIFTNSSCFHARNVLTHLDLLPFFEDFIDVTMVNPYTKFQKEAFTIALELIGNPDPGTCVMVDDEEEIIDNAVSMGLKGILVRKEPLSNHNGHVQIPSINLLPKALEKLSEKY